MYFDKDLSNKLLNKISQRMPAAASLLLGNHEELPLDQVEDLKKVDKGINLYKKSKKGYLKYEIMDKLRLLEKLSLNFPA